MNDEIWKDIKGYEGLYQVSNYGRVKSLARLKHHGNGNYYMTKEKIIKNMIMPKGYIHVCLTNEYNERNFILVHRLVAEAFIPNPNNLSQINHKNGIKTDNCFENLEWCNQSENQIHAFKMGLQISKKGEDRHNVKLTENNVIEIRNLKGKLSQKEIGNLYNVSQRTIWQIYKNKSWKHI